MKWHITVGSSLDREDMVADIFYDKQGIIEISQEKGFYEISFFESIENEYPLSEVLEMINKAIEKMESLKRKSD